MYQLRDYQTRAIADIRRDLTEVDRTLAIMATGTGKTATFLAWLDECLAAGELGRALVVAHRRELIQQPIDRMADHFPQLSPLSGVVMADRNDVSARVIVATVQTLAAKGRMDAILAHGPITHVVIDECHHTTAATYRKVIDQLPAAKVLGVTATPLRADGDGLSRVFERVSVRLPISAAIRAGALVPFDALGVQLPISLAGLRETADGWEAEPLGNLLSAANVLEIVIDHWRQYAQGRQTIAFTASVAQAAATAQAFEAAGIKAAFVSGETPLAERDDILKRYSRGDLQLVANCQVLVEGFDAPATSAVLMICPTKSDLAYVQKLGRGLRTSENKSDCRVIDFAPLEDRDVIMAGDVLGKPRDVKQAEAKAQRSGVMCAIGVDALGEAATIDPSRLIVKVLNLLRKDALAWTVDGVYTTATLTADETLCIVMPDTARVAQAEAMRASGAWTPAHEQLLRHIRSCRLYHVNGAARHVGTYVDFEGAKAAADLIALDNFDAKLSKRRADWRSKQPSPAQIAFAHRLHIQIPERCTKGGLAQLITHKLTVTRAEKADRTVAKKAMKGQS
ncbi:MAG: type I restriction enzyme EcoKI subunit R [Alphaproteobacteria bacterium ADurb.BinA305]|nr:MAG: type I restriction enzyme EcoKI subunit R [Alphaproteobacteria bacterium ADurb.BinA305]